MARQTVMLARRKLRTDLVRLLSGACLTAVLVLGWSGCSKKSSETVDESIQAPETASGVETVSLTADQIDVAGIDVAPVARGSIDVNLRLTGEVSFDRNRFATISAPLSGVVHEVRKTTGNFVESGDVLLVLSSRDLARAKSDYMAIGQKSALALHNYERLKGLWEDKIASEQDYLDAQQAYTELQIDLKTTKEQLLILGLSPADVEAIKSGESTDLTQYELKAPFAGTIVEQFVSLGERVQPEAELYTLAATHRVWVFANVYEEDVGKIRLGQRGTVRVQAYPEESFQGEVAWIADAMDESTRTLSIRLDVPNSDQRLKANMFAQVQVAVGVRPDVLVIPESSVQHEPDGESVFVETDTGTFQVRPVQLGATDDGHVEVTAGLEERDRVVVRGAFILRSELEKGSFADVD